MKTYEKIFIIGISAIAVIIITGVTLLEIFWNKSGIWEALLQAYGIAMFPGLLILSYFLIRLFNKTRRKS